MAIDLKSMSRKELEKLLDDAKKALQSVQARERRMAKKAAEQAAAEFGYSLSELTEGDKPARKTRKSKGKAPKAKSKPKYANPANRSETWTGKGRQPNWFRAEVAKGTPAESMEI